jgi:SpoIIAA-like
MSVDLHEDVGGKVLVIKLTGKLTKVDYEHFAPKVEGLIKEHGKLRILVQMHDFQGWAGGAIWEDIKFDLKNFRHIERLALVGERSWEHGMAVFCKPFATATIRYFDRSEVEQAEAWIRADLMAAQRVGSATAVGEQKG